VNLHNSGEPIPANIIEEIFDKYTQALSNKKTHSFSSGIGLAFCKMAIDAHAGEIGAISGKEKGVTFWVTLPV
jgi:K+-sensing histidine kinase KdpD